MTRVKFVGDVHGKMVGFQKIIDETPTSTEIIQVGDMGVGFNNSNPPHFQKNVRFIRGNHDNPALSKISTSYIPDGTFDAALDCFFVGGAWSIDYRFRTPGWNWWPEEECTDAEFGAFARKFSGTKPRVLVSHELPFNASTKIFFDSRRIKGPQFHTRTGVGLQLMVDAHQPEVCIFGHWHMSIDEVVGGTRYICLDELETVELNIGETIEVLK